MMHHNGLGRGKGIRSQAGRRLAPLVEAVERRQLLAGNVGYLAGTVYLNSDGGSTISHSDAYLPGATLNLSIAGQSGIIASTTTDAKGAYLFQGLAPGNYILTEIPPSNDNAVDASYQSQVYPASRLSSTSIAVTVVDPNSLYATNRGVNNNLSIFAKDTLFSRSASDNVGPLTIDLGTNPDGGDVGTGITTFCLDEESALSANGGESFQVIPTNITQLTNGAGGIVSQAAAGQIAYLYNTYGTTTLNNVQAPALQLAIWELIYDGPPNSLTTGNYKVDGPLNASDQARFNQIVAQANAFVSESQGKSESAMFLDAFTPAQVNRPEFSQSLIATNTFNFLNSAGPANSSISGFVYVDANNNGIKESGETPIPNTTVTLTGTTGSGQNVNLTTTTDSTGAYNFANLQAGTYTITETQPTGYLDGKTTQGTPGTGTAGDNVISTITLAQSVKGINNNFGELLPSSLAGFVYVDANNNGDKETGETPIPNTTVSLTGTDDLGASVSLTTTTDSTGAYDFTNLRPGSYTITETQPANYLDGKTTQGTPGTGTAGDNVISAITLAQNVNGVNNNFGELLPSLASLSGYVYVDANNNGIKESGETPIPNTTVTLTGTSSTGQNVNLTTTTDSTGAYNFANLQAGTYTITETQPTGYLDGKTTQGTPGTGTAGDNVISTITLGQSVNGVNNNFGELLPSSLAGFVYVDANNNGVKETGETSIPNTTVSLTGTDDLNASVSLTTTTDATGAYSFNNLRPGSYTISETQPTAYLDGKTTQGTPGTGTVGDNVISAITLAQNVAGTNNNFGELLPGVSSLSGFVYLDVNEDGVKGAGEAPIPGTTITLTGTTTTGTQVSLTTTTDANGAYTFSNLQAGTYTIRETQPTGYLDGSTSQGTPGNGTTGDDFIGNITLAQGVNGTNNNFGELLPSSLSGYVYVDPNNNGIKEPGETPLSGVTITLTGTNDLGKPVTVVTTTDSSGAYNFSGLRPGIYTVTETQPAGYLEGKTTQGTPGNGVVGAGVISNIALAQEITGTNNNFAELLNTVPPGVITNGGSVSSVVLNGIHHQQSRVVVTFDGAINPAVANDPANYHITALGRDQQLFTPDDRNIPVVSVSYDPNTNQVTIIPASHIDFHYHYLLTIDYPATTVSNAYHYAEVFGRSSMTIWDYHGQWITPPAMSQRQLAADQTIKTVAYQRLATRAPQYTTPANTARSSAIRTTSADNSKSTMFFNSTKARSGHRSRMPHRILAKMGRQVSLK